MSEMTTQAPPATSPTSSALADPAVAGQPLPPDEQFWTRYSPHHELPLASVFSVIIHAVGFCVVVLGISYLWQQSKPKPPTIAVAAVKPDLGQQPPAAGGSPGTPDGSETGENLTPDKPTPKEPNDVDQKPEDIAVPDVKQQKIDVKSQPQPVDPNAASVSFSAARQSAHESLERALKRGSGHKGTGTGNADGDGDGDGPGKGGGSPGDARTRRQRRWHLDLSVNDGWDYLRQLHSIGAFIAIPNPGAEGQFNVYRDLNRRPPVPHPEDLSTLTQLYWVDDEPNSVQKLVVPLALPARPPFVAVFMADRFERLLIKREIDHLHRSRPNAGENEIEFTKFGLKFDGDVYVKGQTLKARR